MDRRVQASGLALAAAIAAFALSACGGSSKPDYCSKTTDLKDSVGTLKSDVTSANFGAVKGDVTTIQSDANDVVSSAKQDFPSQTTAVESAVGALKSSVDLLPANPSPQQLLALAPDVTTAVSAVQNLTDATSSACD